MACGEEKHKWQAYARHKAGPFHFQSSQVRRTLTLKWLYSEDVFRW